MTISSQGGEMVRSVTVIGGNIAALRSVEGLRRGGFDGRITWFSDEDQLPYDRPPLTKQVLSGALEPGDVQYHDSDYFTSLDVEPVLGTRVDHVDPHEREVVIGERRVPFERLIVSTGSRPRSLPLGSPPPPDALMTIRTLDDAVELRERLSGSEEIVVIGGGFIGAEVASTTSQLGHHVTVVEAEAAPLSRAVGSAVGRALGALHGRHGTTLLCGRTACRVAGRAGDAEVELDDGVVLRAHLVIVGVGVQPNTELLETSGLTVRGELICDATMRTAHPDIYAAGDVATFYHPGLGRWTRGQQWTTASDQGELVARNLLANDGQKERFSGSMYFWSEQYGSRIQSAGDVGPECTVRVVEGDLYEPERGLIATYSRNGHVSGVVAVNRPKEFAKEHLAIKDLMATALEHK